MQVLDTEDAITCAQQLGVASAIANEDYIFQFIQKIPSFDTPKAAIEAYLNGGHDCAMKLSNVLESLAEHFKGPISLLEFASGYGRVTRHIPAVIPNVNLTACDIHLQAVEFISEQLGQAAILSHKDPKQFNLKQKFDVIFSLSFFSHMPQETWGQWISAHFKHLNPNGALIFTTHGLTSKLSAEHVVLDDNGFGFDPVSEQQDLSTSEYGLSIVTQDFVEKEVLKQTGCPVNIYKPAFWWGHQDLYVVIKES